MLAKFASLVACACVSASVVHARRQDRGSHTIFRTSTALNQLEDATRFIEILRSPGTSGVYEREHAAKELGNLQGGLDRSSLRAAVRALVRALLADPGAGVRLAAARALVKIGHAGQAALDLLGQAFNQAFHRRRHQSADNFATSVFWILSELGQVDKQPVLALQALMDSVVEEQEVFVDQEQLASIYKALPRSGDVLCILLKSAWIVEEEVAEVAMLHAARDIILYRSNAGTTKWKTLFLATKDDEARVRHAAIQLLGELALELAYTAEDWRGVLVAAQEWLMIRLREERSGSVAEVARVYLAEVQQRLGELGDAGH